MDSPCPARGDKILKEFSFYEGKRILITGFSGFLGNEILRLLQDVDCQCLGITRRENFKQAAESNLKIIRGNLDEASLWQEALEGVEIVIHLAAQTSLEFAQKNPEADYRANVLPMIRLLETAKSLKKRLKIIFAGTATEAGIPETLFLDEKHPDRPITVYDAHKLEAEQALKISSSRNEIHGVSLRLCNLYGPGPDPMSSERGVLNQAVLKALKENPLFWYEGHDFIRDYLYVTDGAKAFLRAGEKTEKISGRHFVIGSGQGWKFSEAFQLAAEKVAEAVGKTAVQVKKIAAPEALNPIHSRSVVAQSQAFSNETGWTPEVPLPLGLERTVSYFLKQLVPKIAVGQ